MANNERRNFKPMFAENFNPWGEPLEMMPMYFFVQLGMAPMYEKVQIIPVQGLSRRSTPKNRRFKRDEIDS